MTESVTPPVDTTQPPPVQTPPPVDAGPKMPDGLEPRFWDQQTGAVKVDDLVKNYGELARFKTEADVRAAAIPQDPNGYKPDLPADFQIPEAFKDKVAIDPNHPLMPVARQMAKELGLSQEGFSKLLALDVQRMVAEHQHRAATKDAELNKLGAQRDDRVNAVNSYLKANLTEDRYKALLPQVNTAAAFEAIEDLIAKANGSRIPGDRSAVEQPPQQQPPSVESRWYPGLAPQQQKAS